MKAFRSTALFPLVSIRVMIITSTCFMLSIALQIPFCISTHTHSYFSHLNLIILPLLLCANKWCHPQKRGEERRGEERRGEERRGEERRGEERRRERRGEEEEEKKKKGEVSKEGKWGGTPRAWLAPVLGLQGLTSLLCRWTHKIQPPSFLLLFRLR